MGLPGTPPFLLGPAIPYTGELPLPTFLMALPLLTSFISSDAQRPGVEPPPPTGARMKLDRLSGGLAPTPCWAAPTALEKATPEGVGTNESRSSGEEPTLIHVSVGFWAHFPGSLAGSWPPAAA